MAPATGICQASDQFKPLWVAQVFSNFDQCCENSWIRDKCLAAKPVEAYDPSPNTSANPPTSAPTYTPTAPSPIRTPPPVNDGGSPSTFNPVTGSFTCKAPGMACTINCSSCGTITHLASGMTMESPDKSTIIYRAERGTDDWPNDPSRLILVESDNSGANVISCDEGCTCDVVNDNISGCGIEVEPTPVHPIPTDPSAVQSQDNPNCSALKDSSLYLMLCIFLVWTVLR